MLGLLPSVYGLAAAVAFALLALIALDADRWLETAAFMLLAVAYFLRHIPKLLVLSILNLPAHIAFLVGAVLFVYSVADRIDLF